MKINDLKKNLKNESRDILETQIIELFKKSKFVKDYYLLKYDGDADSSVLVEHKNIIEREFFPKRGFGKARLSIAKKSITEFKKLSRNKLHLAELMIFYVEMGVKFTNDYGDIDESFYLSMEGMYEQVVKFIVNEKLESSFVDRCGEIVNDTNGIGWGFHDQLRVTYDEYLGDENT